MKERLKVYLSVLREYAGYILAFLVLLSLLVKVLLPQVQNIITNRLALSESNQKLKSLRDKAQTLENLDKIVTREKLQGLNLALPLEKDVGLMLGTLERVATRSNVKLGSFSFSVGSLATPPATSTGSQSDVPSFQVVLNLGGELDKIVNFISEIRTTVPVMRVASFSFSGGPSSTMTLLYYYKPLRSPPGGVTTPLPQISQKQEEIYQQILERENSLSKEPESSVVEEGIGSRANPFY